MSLRPFPVIFRILATRVFVVYLLIAGGIFFFTDHKAVVRSAQLQTLSRLTPSFNYYQKLIQDPKARDVVSLQECLYYHKAVADLVPSVKGEAWGVAGFCAYQLGRRAEAKALWEKSTAAVPVFFWSHYNQGVMAFNQGSYEQAGRCFSRALQMDPKYTLYLVTKSKVYADIYRSFQGTYDFEGTLLKGYERAAGLLKLSVACHADPQAAACQKRPVLDPRLF